MIDIELTQYKVEQLPAIDQRQIKRGKCPWCSENLVDGSLIEGGAGDICIHCHDEFIGKLTIED